MTISRDVIIDLLPLYLAGEASPDSVRLVTTYLESDPSLAAEVRRQQSVATPRPVLPVHPDLELVALHRARRTLALRQWSFGLALFFTALSLSVEFHADASGLHETRSLVVEYFATLWWLPACAAAAWAVYLTVRRRARI
jgi:anti-sigma factor RsiW